MYVEGVAVYKSIDTKGNDGSKKTSVKEKKDTRVSNSESIVKSTDGESAIDKKNDIADISRDAVSLEIGHSAKEIAEAEAEKRNKAAEEERKKRNDEMKKAQFPNSEIKFGIHEKTERVTIKIVDRDTKEVLKEFPPEKSLDLIAKSMEIAGVLVDAKL